MTTMDAAAARRWHPKVALAILIATAGTALAGCSGSVLDFANNTPPEQAAPQKPAVAQAAIAKVSVAPIIGAPDAIAKQIQQEFTGAVEQQRVNVVTGKDERADYTLRGYVVAAKDKANTKVSYIWDVTDPTGKRVNRITGEEIVTGNSSKDPWAALTPAVAQNIANKAASSFVTWVSTHANSGAMASGSPGQPAGIGAQAGTVPSAPGTAAAEPDAKPARPVAKQIAAPAPAAAPTTGSIGREGPVTAIVPSVTGAPGDGSASLTAAIQKELTSKGVQLGDRPTGASYRVEGTVTMGEAKEGKQSIHIEWLVRDPQGKKLGTVSQRNEIPAGSLDGTWGPTATQAAGAAAQGIIKLLPQPKAVN